MKISQNNYIEFVEKKSPNTKEVWSLIKAFVVGGIICMVGQLLMEIYQDTFWMFTEVQIASAVSGTLIFIGATLTGLGLYDQLGAFAGAGSMVPITGFANSVVSPALEFKSEGMIYGLASKMFIIAGPIIVYGVIGSGLVGLVYYFIYMWG